MSTTFVLCWPIESSSTQCERGGDIAREGLLQQALLGVLCVQRRRQLLLVVVVSLCTLESWLCVRL